MKQKCYFCGTEAEIIRDPDGNDRDFVKCPICTEYSIDATPIAKILNMSKPITNLSNKAKKHFKDTGEPFNFGTIEIDCFK